MIDGKNFFDQLINSMTKILEKLPQAREMTLQPVVY